jgi:lysyl-tRNA synthetase class 2
MLWRPRASLATLERRAAARSAVRAYFAEQGFLEIETPVMQQASNTDPGIVPVTAGPQRYLATSPEHALKRCLAAGYGDCFALAPVARAGELGQEHEPQFTMLEWYRIDWDLPRLQQEILHVLELVTQVQRPLHTYRYAECFERFAQCSPDDEQTIRALTPSLPQDADHAERCDFVLASIIQPRFDPTAWTVVSHWPAAQAAQARLCDDGTAARLEVYAGAIELANAYDEETNATVLQERLALTGDAQGLGVDRHLIAACAAGLPQCSGVAVGFDRLMQVALGLPNVADTMAFDWQRS